MGEEEKENEEVKKLQREGFEKKKRNSNNDNKNESV